MSGVLCIRAGFGEPTDDILINTLYDASKGKGDKKLLARIGIRRTAISELAQEGLDRAPEYDENGSRLVTRIYENLESVHKDFAVHDYGVSPFPAHFLPVLDSFAVFGRLKGSDAGFILDYFRRDIRPLGTIAFSRSSPETLVSKAARDVFNFKNPFGRDAYSEIVTKRGLIDLRTYGRERGTRAVICEGQLAFTGKPRTQSSIAKQTLKSCLEYEGFIPETFVINHYDFTIDFGPKDGKQKFQRRYKELGERIGRVFEKKPQIPFKDRKRASA